MPITARSRPGDDQCERDPVGELAVVADGSPHDGEEDERNYQGVEPRRMGNNELAGVTAARAPRTKASNPRASDIRLEARIRARTLGWAASSTIMPPTHTRSNETYFPPGRCVASGAASTPKRGPHHRASSPLPRTPASLRSLRRSRPAAARASNAEPATIPSTRTAPRLPRRRARGATVSDSMRWAIRSPTSRTGRVAPYFRGAIGIAVPRRPWTRVRNAAGALTFGAPMFDDSGDIAHSSHLPIKANPL